MEKRFVMTTLGTFGDLHPYLAVAIELRKRGHEVTIASSEMYRAKIEGEGIRFHPVRPDLAPVFRDPETIRRVLDAATGAEFYLRQILLAHLEESYEDLLQACRGKDLLVSHTLAFALPLVAEKLRLPWVSVALQPITLFSVYDPCGLPTVKKPFRICRLRDWEFALLLGYTSRRTRAWMKPIDDLRDQLGLAPANGHPFFEGKFSPYGTLAWFCRLLASPRPDWPPLTKITGFPFYDRQEAGRGLDPRLSEFLEKAEPPIVFTLGTQAVLDAGDFFDRSVTAARQLGCRAVLLMNAQARSRLRTSLPDTLFVGDYAPYSALFPRAAAIVHQGGIGTIGQALRAGRPSLVVPFFYDQPDNALRVAELGVARVLDRRLYTAKRAQTELTRLLFESSYTARAEDIAREIRNEEGASAACDVLEDLVAAA